MISELPNIEKLRVALPATLHLKFRGRKWRPVNLGGLIAREEFLAPLKEPGMFAQAKVIDWGGGVGWPDDRDLSASTLWRMSDEQARFTNKDFADWQARLGLSNQETADALGLSIRTIKNIRSGAVPVSQVVSIACRAMEADPTLLAAHYAPRFAGRPKAA
jgi:hypothetical protein